MTKPKTTKRPPRDPGMSAPATLSEAAANLWRALFDEYDFGDRVGRILLEEALIAWDRARDAAAMVARDGAVIRGSDGVPRRHPAVSIERDSRAQFVRVLRELGVNLEPVGDARDQLEEVVAKALRGFSVVQPIVLDERGSWTMTTPNGRTVVLGGDGIDERERKWLDSPQ